MNRLDPIDHIIGVNRGRAPALLRRKFAAMAHDPFAFLRATAMLGHRAVDLAALPATPIGWVCGDLHLQNFGCFRGSNRLVYFDLNDFDEAARLPVCIDLLRFLGSIHTAAAGMNVTPAKAQELAGEALAAYAAALVRGKAFWLERDTATGPIGALLRQVGKRKRLSLLAARTHVVDGRRRMTLDEHRYLPVAATAPIRHQLATALRELSGLYGDPAFFQERDLAFRIAGMGSLGIPRYVVLVQGKGDPDRNALIDFKFAAPSSAVAAMPQFAQPAWQGEAARVVAIQDVCEAASPAYLSALSIGGAPFVARELQPVEDRVALAPLAREKKTLDRTLRAMARLAAFAQLRSAGRLGAAGVDEFMAFGRAVQAQPAPWLAAARAIDAANTVAFRHFQAAWADHDARLTALCADAPVPGRRLPARRSPVRGRAAS
jgi:uncharacterized protein (DUF2252 family)